MIYVKHNLFLQNKLSRTIELNKTHIILFKSPRDIQQITYVGKHLNNTNFLKESYELATKQAFGHFRKTSDSLRFCSNIVQPGPTFFYLPSFKAVITTLTNSFINFLCECLLNVINGNVPANKQLLKNQEKSLQQLLSKKTSLEKKQNVLAKKPELIRALGLSC